MQPQGCDPSTRWTRERRTPYAKRETFFVLPTMKAPRSGKPGRDAFVVSCSKLTFEHLN